MSIERKIKQRTKRRIQRVRKEMRDKGTPRVSVSRSSKHIYAQLIDDIQQKTVASCSSLECKGLTGDKKEKAHAIGLKLAEKAKKLGIEVEGRDINDIAQDIAKATQKVETE